MIGTESKLPEITLGLASLGSCASTEAIAEFKRSIAVSVVVPNWNETLRTDSPVVEVAVVDSRPSRPITAFSITEETWESTTSGDAPG